MLQEGQAHDRTHKAHESIGEIFMGTELLIYTIHSTLGLVFKVCCILAIMYTMYKVDKINENLEEIVKHINSHP